MQETDMRIDAPDNLTVKFQHKPKHAVGRRMLWAEIDGEIAKAGFWHGETHGCCDDGPSLTTVDSQAERENQITASRN
jgi:hypothetical protein